MDSGKQRRHAHQRHAGQILFAVVRQFGVQRVVGCISRNNYRKGAAVSLRFGQCVYPNDAVGAGLVVYDHRLLQTVLQANLHDARHLISEPTGRVRHDDANRFAGPGTLSKRRKADGAGCTARDYCKTATGNFFGS